MAHCVVTHYLHLLRAVFEKFKASVVIAEEWFVLEQQGALKKDDDDELTEQDKIALVKDCMNILQSLSSECAQRTRPTVAF